jgi:AcrR family transcriptional regulator
METRETQILKVAVELFGSQGYDRTSLQDIADVVGITKPALYYYFRDKDALYARVVVQGLSQLVEYVQNRVEALSEPEARVHEFILSAATFLEENRSTWLLASHGFWAATDGPLRGEALALRDKFESLLRTSLSDAVATGSLREIDVALAGRLILSGLNQIHRWHSPTGSLTVVQVAERYLDFVLNGLRMPSR